MEKRQPARPRLRHPGRSRLRHPRHSRPLSSRAPAPVIPSAFPIVILSAAKDLLPPQDGPRRKDPSSLALLRMTGVEKRQPARSCLCHPRHSRPLSSRAPAPVILSVLPIVILSAAKDLLPPAKQPSAERSFVAGAPQDDRGGKTPVCAPPSPSPRALPSPPPQALPPAVIPSAFPIVILSAPAPVIPSAPAPIIPGALPIVILSAAKDLLPSPTGPMEKDPSSLALLRMTGVEKRQPARSCLRHPGHSRPLSSRAPAPVIPSAPAPVIPSAPAPVIPSAPAPIIPGALPIVILSAAKDLLPSPKQPTAEKDPSVAGAPQDDREGKCHPGRSRALSCGRPLLSPLSGAARRVSAAPRRGRTPPWTPPRPAPADWAASGPAWR